MAFEGGESVTKEEKPRILILSGSDTSTFLNMVRKYREAEENEMIRQIKKNICERR